MSDQGVRRALLFKTALEVLQDQGGPLPPRLVLEEISNRVALSPHELGRYASGRPRWEVTIRFFTGEAATIGWMTKRGGWSITEAGTEALEDFPTPEGLLSELHHGYREIDHRRKRAQRNLNDIQQFLAKILDLVDVGAWTAQDDLAELAGTTPAEVADFLASGKIRLANGYRVLNADGSIPAEGMLNVSYRGIDLHERLAEEGIEFSASGLAAQDQRLTAESLMELLTVGVEDTTGEATATAGRAWMVRGSNVEGFNLVPDWLHDGFVSLSASQLGHLDPGASHDELKQAVETGYQHKSYAYRGQRLEEFDRFLRRMRSGDLVLTTMRGQIYLGEVAGPARFAESEHGLSNLRREVRWRTTGDPVDGSQLRAPVPALLQSQAYIVDLTEAYDQLAGLIPPDATRQAPAAVPELPKRSLAFNPVTDAIAEELLMDQAELTRIVDVLWERRQVILYGPPGTGKTFLATRLARQLTDDGAVKLVQFHPSYAYEDFFEGFRPEPGSSGTLTFTLRAGPFRDFAEVAAANPSTAYILIIDEINRANLAKVFGELYFLLEYRDESISLQYSPDKEFTLPQNLFIIGTMNTADRSIARIDTAMRRRFAFVALDPRIPPVLGLLSRWLERHHLPLEAAALLDELNRLLADSDAAIGPSYLMDERIYRRDDGLSRVWQYSIMPLLEDLFYGQADLDQHYGLPSLRKAITAPPAEP
jgi:5-methylcytosine-specific restriction protein B